MGAPPPLDKAFAALAALQIMLSPPKKKAVDGIRPTAGRMCTVKAYPFSLPALSQTLKTIPQFPSARPEAPTSLQSHD